MTHRHALDCACDPCRSGSECPACGTWTQGGPPAGCSRADACPHCGTWPKPERDRIHTATRRVEIEVPVREGDHVWVEDGMYRGCILDLVRREQWGTVQYWICKRTTFPYEVRTRRVSLYRRVAS